jgi:hypothetical protein
MVDRLQTQTLATYSKTERGMSRKTLFAAVTLASVAYLAGLIYYAQVRPIDGDEGYYTTAARLVWEGKTPYRDFSYPQGPLLPYIYSWIWAVHPQSLVSMRFLSVACGSIAVLLWGLCLVSVERLPAKVALATFAVVLLNPDWVSWNVVVKTFAVSNLLMTLATICFYVALHSERFRWYFAAGLALGACASARLLYAPLIPCVLLWLLQRDWRSSKPPYPKTLACLAGATCGLLPIIFSFVHDPRAFIFNNVQYHRLLTEPATFRHTAHVYVLTIVMLVFSVYLTAEVGLAGVGAFSLLKVRKKPDAPYTRQDYRYFELALLMLVVYTVTAFLPFPPADQYFESPLVPFLIPFVAEGLRVTFQAGTKWMVFAAALAPLLFLHDVRRGAIEYAGAPESQFSSYRKITQIIEANTKANDVVLSFWPGYVFESGRRYLPSAENHFAYYVADRISAEERARYDIASKGLITDAVSARAASLVVTSAWIFDKHLTSTELQAFHNALNNNYLMVDKIGAVEIYRPR